MARTAGAATQQGRETDVTAPIVLSVVVPVFNATPAAERLVRAMLAQTFERPWELILVDDGSVPDLGRALAHLADERLRVVRLAENRGRAAARNAGARAASGDCLVFLDVDCLPADHGFLHAHARAMAMGHDLSYGPVSGAGTDFGSRYLNAVARRRLRAFCDERSRIMTTENVCLRRTAFKAVNGYDERYRHYGFEDIDLLLRLEQASPRFTLSETAAVRHEGSLRLASVCRKLEEAGARTARIFRSDHLSYYRTTAYAHLDTTLHPCLRPYVRICRRTWPVLARFVDRFGLLDRLPYPIAATIVKLGSAMAFIAGTGTPPAPDT